MQRKSPGLSSLRRGHRQVHHLFLLGWMTWHELSPKPPALQSQQTRQEHRVITAAVGSGRAQHRNHEPSGAGLRTHGRLL